MPDTLPESGSNHKTPGTLADVMGVLQALADAVTHDQWKSWHIAVKRAAELEMTAEQVTDAYRYRVGRDQRWPSFELPQPHVTTWDGSHSGWRFAHCALCDWSEHGPNHIAVSTAARRHQCPADGLHLR